MKRKFFVAIGLVALCGVVEAASAEELTVSGSGKSPITPNISETRQESLRIAKRAAVVEAVKKINGPASISDPKVQAAIDQIAVQIGDDKIFDQTNSKDAANNYVTRVTLKIDELEFRQMLQDNGIASTVARNFPVLVVMDEFFTTPTDHTKPIRELVEYSHDKTATFDASQASAESAESVSAESSRSSYSGAASYAARGSSSGAFAAGGYGEALYASGRQSASAAGSIREKSQSSSDSFSQSSASSSSSAHVFDQQKDVVNFRKLVEYQPQNVGPDRNNYTYAALVREASQYDLKLLDNDLFRSKYFTGKPLTMEEMQNSSELARYASYARDNKADYFMVGNTIIINNNKNETGMFVCDGLVTLKAYSTEDGSLLVSDARSESASGASPDQCRVNVANKLAGFVGKKLGSTIQNYWKLRETYGQEYNIKLVSLLGNLPDDVKDSFAEAIESINGLQSKVNERKSTRYEYEVAITYKGDKSLARAISSALKKNTAFSATGRKVDGNSLKFCLEGPCPEK